MLLVDKVNVKYGDVQVLWDVSLRVDEGEIVALLGSNGSGKTTLVRTIVGLVKPFSGTIMFMGERIDNKKPHEIVRMGIACVPEGRRIFPKLKVIENLRVGSYNHVAKKLRKENLNRIFKIFPILYERRNQLAGTLSGGESQMLAIARSLMACPKLLIFDEPTLGLAPKISSVVFETIKKIKEEGITVLLSEQNVRKALEISNRAYVMESGKVKLEGQSAVLLGDPLIKKAYLGL
jgi:branched-chain amino acid transport system ATP-binding protein